MLVVNAEETHLDANNQFQVDYLVEYIERLEAQANDEQLQLGLNQTIPSFVKLSSILSADELTMLTQLFYPKPKM
ncbi:hypothetical protein [Shewanella sp. MBTL60-007]|uniref:hypothetical protein n=1 Tax=Shewanella sp. MBTL60-007 TaxID=2815911 RepID=UPI001BBC3289|nr:hypothetical protein [Shewanella sp. MBTL60-007]GIU28599.1 hypothetical protein TUM3792_37510 [Shewanella sp. MBTL60-007]